MANVTFRIKKRKTNNGKGTIEKPQYDYYWEKYNEIYVRYGNALTKIDYKVEVKHWSFTTNSLKPSYKPEDPTTIEKIKGVKPLSKQVLIDVEALITRLDNEMSKKIKRDSAWLKSVIGEFHGTAIKGNVDKTFIDFLRKYINKKGLYVAKGSYAKPEDTIEYHDHPIVRRFKEFDNGRNLMPNELTDEIVTEFINKYKGCYLGNSLKLDIVAWKGALMIAADHEFKIANYKNWELKILKDDDRPSPVILSEQEIDTLFHFDCKNDSLNNVRVLFVAMYYSGQRYSDFTANLEGFKHTKEKILKIKQKKTGKVVKIPIMIPMRDVLSQFDARAVNTPFFDRTIKKVCKMAGIDEPTLGRLRWNGRKILLGDKNSTKFENRDVMLPKYEWCGSHSARRSFATHFEYKLGRVDTMKITGHTKEANFLLYIGQTPDENFDKLEKIGLM